MIPVEHRSHEHGSEADVKARLEREAAQFRDTTTEGSTRHTSSTAPVIGGEHVHHHVHENIQPVVQKGTLLQLFHRHDMELKLTFYVA